MKSAPKIDGGMAFPAPSDHPFETGMSLRDYFAGQALIAVLVMMRSGPAREMPEYAAEAYAWADDMLKAREAK